MAVKAGMSYREFINSTLAQVSIRIGAYLDTEHRRMREMQYSAWLNGLYVRGAIASTLGKAKYPDSPDEEDRKQRMLNGNLTEKEKIEYTKQLFASLEIQKTNFELERKAKET